MQYSSDYVFDGSRESEAGHCAPGGSPRSDPPAGGEAGCCGGSCHTGEEKGSPRLSSGEAGYREDALPNPISRYGTSKYLGEEAVRKTAKRFYIIRPSKMFGRPARSALAKKSFFATMLELGKTKDRVEGIDGEKSCFTYAPDLAQATRSLIEDDAESGVYHLVNEGPATWYEGIVELYRQAGLKTQVRAVAPEDFPIRPAKRPPFSVLANTKRPKLRPYQEALGEFLKSMPGSEISIKTDKKGEPRDFDKF